MDQGLSFDPQPPVVIPSVPVLWLLPGTSTDPPRPQFSLFDTPLDFHPNVFWFFLSPALLDCLVWAVKNSKLSPAKG